MNIDKKVKVLLKMRCIMKKDKYGGLCAIAENACYRLDLPHTPSLKTLGLIKPKNTRKFSPYWFKKYVKAPRFRLIDNAIKEFEKQLKKKK